MKPPMAAYVVDIGESLMMNKILLKLEKEEIEIVQRKDLFRNVCKSKGKCFQVVIDSGRTDNLVAT